LKQAAGANAHPLETFSGGSCSLGSGTSSSICSSSGPSGGAGMLEKQITSLGHKLDIVEKLPKKWRETTIWRS